MMITIIIIIAITHYQILSLKFLAYQLYNTFRFQRNMTIFVRSK